MPTYAGTAIRQTATFRDDGGTLVDPSVVTFKFRSTESTDTTCWQYQGAGSIDKVSTGVYRVLVDTTDLAGELVTEWEGDGVAVGVWSRKIDAVPL